MVDENEMVFNKMMNNSLIIVKNNFVKFHNTLIDIVDHVDRKNLPPPECVSRCLSVDDKRKIFFFKLTIIVI